MHELHFPFPPKLVERIIFYRHIPRYNEAFLSIKHLHATAMAVVDSFPQWRQRRTTSIAFALNIIVLLSLYLKLASSLVNSPKASARGSSCLSMGTTSVSSSDIVCSESTQNAFHGKSVLLTGASGGLGQALALQLAHCGVKTLVLSARSHASLQAVANECQDISSSTTIHVVTCDLSNRDSVIKLGEEAVKLCDVDILINNGGVSSRSHFIDTKPEVDATVMEINFLSGASLAKAVVPGMVERSYGSIIWISSVQGLCK